MEEQREKNNRHAKQVLFIEDAVDGSAARFVKYFNENNDTGYGLNIAPTIMEAVDEIYYTDYDMIIFDNHVDIGKAPDAEKEPDKRRFYERYERLARLKVAKHQQFQHELHKYRPEINPNTPVYLSMVSRMEKHKNAPILGYEFLFSLYGAVHKTYAMVPLPRYPPWIKRLFAEKQIGIFTIDNVNVIEDFLEACNLTATNYYQWKANADDDALLKLVHRISRAKTK